jgi:hypothetical protein
MQAFVLFLITVRTQIDPHTFWIMTGVAVRIAQRIGLHRDGESLGIPPFDLEIRRRLFWQLLPLDGYAGQVSGTGISIAPNSWDTKQPLNINDDQIYPGMTQQPEEQKGATEMIYCLTRTELSKFYTRTGVKMKDIGATIQLRDGAELKQLIDEVESIIETKYLRYCQPSTLPGVWNGEVCRKCCATTQPNAAIDESNNWRSRKERALCSRTEGS